MCFMQRAIEIKKHPRLPILVTSDGQVFNNGRWLKLTVREDGYVICGINKKTYRVHRLVLETFVGDCPEGMDARHLVNDKLNNSIDNLKWGTRQEQIADMKAAGTFKPPPIRRKRIKDEKPTDSADPDQGTEVLFPSVEQVFVQPEPGMEVSAEASVCVS